MTKCEICGERPMDESDKILWITILIFVFCGGYQSYRFYWFLTFLQDRLGIWPDVASLKLINGIIDIILIVTGVIILIFAVLTMLEN